MPSESNLYAIILDTFSLPEVTIRRPGQRLGYKAPASPLTRHLNLQVRRATVWLRCASKDHGHRVRDIMYRITGIRI